MAAKLEAPSKALEIPVPAVSIYNETLKIALYGKFGSEKTRQIAHLIDMAGIDNVLVLSAERGLGTIRSKITSERQVIPITNMAELRAAFIPVREFATENPDRWVVADGMSSITEWLANDQLSGAERYYDSKAQGRAISQSDAVFGRYITDKGAIDSMRIYGRIGRDSENLLNAFLSLPCNLYANYLEDFTGSSGFEKGPPLGPDVPGKVGLKAVMSSFDFVGRLSYGPRGELTAGFDSRSNYYMALTREDGTQVKIPKEIVNFNLAEFVRLIKGEIKELETENP